MDTQMLLDLAAELRQRALQAAGMEQAELLFLAEEYERLAARPDGQEQGFRFVVLPK